MHRFLSSFVFVFVLVCQLAVLSSCKKDSNTPSNVNPDLATVSTDRVESITLFSATVVSTVSKEGKSAVTGMGIAYGKNPNPTVVADNNVPYASFGVGTFSTSLDNLESGTTYYVRAYATNAAGTAYASQLSFTTTAVVLATLNTTNASFIRATSASIGGNISNDGGGSITGGVCWSTSPNPTIALTTKTSDAYGTGIFTSYLGGLVPNTLYYVRSYATNSAGVAYGNEITFTTLTLINVFNPNLTYGTMSDNDGNTYKTIPIGTQTWMAENLKTTKYRNGDPIPTSLTDAAWNSTTTGAYAIYNNDFANNTTYGKLYNWYAVADTRNLCPAGWHVPSDAEWTTLEDYLGGSSVAGGKLKSTSTPWNTPNTGATNESGFSGLPGGNRNFNGAYDYIGNFGNWWSSTGSSTYAFYRGLNYDVGYSDRRGFNVQNGFSVRCLRD